MSSRGLARSFVRGSSSRIRWGLIIVVLLALALIASTIVKVPYVILKPGPAPNTLGELDGKKILTVTGTKTYPTTGGLHFTTVSLYGGPGRKPSLLEYLFAKADSTAQVFPERQFFAPEQTKEQVSQQNKAEMTGSQNAAEVVAARKAGFTVREKIVIAGVADGTDAAKVVKKDDVITSLNGVSITESGVLQTEMKKVKPGDKVNLTVTRAGKPMTFSIGTKDVKGRAVMGLALDTQVEKMPFKVTLAVGDVGGPSAGLMFTLAIYDQITPGALTGGKQIAGTGEMAPNGELGPIGGIREKVVGAKDSGATDFLAPADNCDELKGHVPSGLNVYRVANIDDAIKTVQGVAAGKTQGFPRCG